jgi:hypothetical protein
LQESAVKLKELIEGWPLDGWSRGSLTWDNDPGILRLAAVREPGAAGTFDLTAGDAQLCRWSNSLVVRNSAHHAAVSEALAHALGKTLSEAGEIEIAL